MTALDRDEPVAKQLGAKGRTARSWHLDADLGAVCELDEHVQHDAFLDLVELWRLGIEHPDGVDGLDQSIGTNAVDVFHVG